MEGQLKRLLNSILAFTLCVGGCSSAVKNSVQEVPSTTIKEQYFKDISNSYLFPEVGSIRDVEGNLIGSGVCFEVLMVRSCVTLILKYVNSAPKHVQVWWNVVTPRLSDYYLIDFNDYDSEITHYAWKMISEVH